MYKIASDLAQRRARQLWLADIGGPTFQALTAEQQRDSLVAKLKGIDTQIAKHEPKSEWRLALGQIKCELQEQIHALRPKRKSDKLKDVHHRFIEVAKERLHKLEYQRIMDEATQRAKDAHSAGPVGQSHD